MINNVHKVEGEKIDIDGANNAIKKVLIGEKEGWDDYVLRVIELGLQGTTPKHIHDFPHIIYVLKGYGILHFKEEIHKLKEGSYTVIPSNKLHQFQNIGEGTFQFICIVPKEGN